LSPAESILDPTPRIVIMSAIPSELDKLLAAARVETSHDILGRTHHVGTLFENDVVLLLGGVSMVNTAMTTQAVFDRFRVAALVYSGIAGGANPDLGIGDVAVPAQWAQYQEHVFARETKDGWDTGSRELELGNFGMMFPRGVRTPKLDDAPDTTERKLWFPADARMLETARAVAGSVELRRCTKAGECLDRDPAVHVGGNGVSGPTFVNNTAYREWVWQTFQPDAIDMETAAAAYVAYVNRVPFIGFRSLSDLAGGGSGRNKIRIFRQLAADNSASVVLAFLKRWSNRPD
jgi:adenosylhomocysteine nucleosidase